MPRIRLLTIQDTLPDVSVEGEGVYVFVFRAVG